MITKKLKDSINNTIDSLINDLKKNFIDYQLIETKIWGRNRLFKYYTLFNHNERKFNEIVNVFVENLNYVKFSIFLEYKRNNRRIYDSIYYRLIDFNEFKKPFSTEKILINVLNRIEDNYKNEILYKLNKNINSLVDRGVYDFKISFIFTIHAKEYIYLHRESTPECTIEFIKNYKVVNLFWWEVKKRWI